MNAQSKTIAAAAFLVSFAGAYSLLPLQGSVFSDVPDDAPYAAAVQELKQDGIVAGYDDGVFRPYQTINRAEFVKIIAGSRYDLTSEESDQCMIRNKRANDTLLFPDVPWDSWYARHLCMSYEHRLIEGYPDGTFGGEKEITFIEAAKILTVAYEPTIYPGKTNWYDPYTQKLKEWSAIPPSVIALNQKITRGEMADMTYRVRHANDDVATATGATVYVPDPSYTVIPTMADPPPPPPSSEASSIETASGDIVPTGAEIPSSEPAPTVQVFQAESVTSEASSVSDQ